MDGADDIPVGAFGRRIGGEQHAAALGRDHALNDDGDPAGVGRQPVLRPVAQGAFGERGGPAAADVGDDLAETADVQEAVELAGEGVACAVLPRAGRADGHRAAAGQPVGQSDGVRDTVVERCGLDQAGDLRGDPAGARPAVVGEQPCQVLVQSAAAAEFREYVQADDRPARYLKSGRGQGVQVPPFSTGPFGGKGFVTGWCEDVQGPVFGSRGGRQRVSPPRVLLDLARMLHSRAVQKNSDGPQQSLFGRRRLFNFRVAHRRSGRPAGIRRLTGRSGRSGSAPLRSRPGRGGRYGAAAPHTSGSAPAFRHDGKVAPGMGHHTNRDRHKATRSDTGKGRPERKATNIDAIDQRA